MCLHGGRYGDIEQQWFLNFLDAHRPHPEDNVFAFVWHADWCHDILNGIKMADQPTLKMFKKMKQNGDLEKGVLMFISDHGFRQGAFASSAYGEMDNNLPFMFISFPTWFEKQFPELVANVRRNANRLVTAYDIHKTLQHFLHMQTEETPWKNDFPDKDGLVPQESYSVLTEVPLNRTCATAGISDTFCGCAPSSELDLSQTGNGDVKLATDGAAALIDAINLNLKDKNLFDICYHWKLVKFVRAKKVPTKRLFMVRVETVAFDESREYGNMTATIEGWVTKQNGGKGSGGGGGGEGTVGRDGETYVNGFVIKLTEASRVDHYGDTSACVLQRARDMKKFCRCRDR